ncbi:MAG: EF-P lysine aminoacylase EpmA [Planctomycetota bacterium]
MKAVTPEIDFFPTASLENLHLRARLLKAVRRFFDERGYLEVETPLISADATIDPNLSPFITRWIPAGASPDKGMEMYLQTSPEFAMKRLLAALHVPGGQADATAIYQITHAFRNGEFGRLHNPEFTLVEWYRTGDTCHEQMDEVQELVCTVGEESDQWEMADDKPFLRTSYREAFERYADFDPLSTETSKLPEIALSRGLTPPPGLAPGDRDGWLNFFLVELVESNLGRDCPQFLYDYPASQAALARIRPDDPLVAERFELYFHGVEICNGYHEETDPEELRRRIRAHGMEQHLTSRLLDAMEAGLPPCSGVALGFDRLVMLAAGALSLAEVMPFPFDRA